MCPPKALRPMGVHSEIFIGTFDQCIPGVIRSLNQVGVIYVGVGGCLCIIPYDSYAMIITLKSVKTLTSDKLFL